MTQTELQRRRELERLSKPELITKVIDAERALAEERAGRGRFDRYRAAIDRVRALEPMWPRGMYGCPQDMFGRAQIAAALDHVATDIESEVPGV